MDPAAATDSTAETDVAAAALPTLQPGPHAVGTRFLAWHDASRDRAVPTRLWFPVDPTAAKNAKAVIYLDAGDFSPIGSAVELPTPLTPTAKLPLVLFSHGFKGIHWQSFTLCEFIASHGFVVAAMDHVGNTLLDFNASKRVESRSALERPLDVAFAHAQVQAAAGAGGWLHGVVDLDRVGVVGHSFGGYTALVVAGATVDVDAAKPRCQGADNLMCKRELMQQWPDGTVLSLAKPLPGLRAAVGLAPGFFVAFGAAGLAGVAVPTLVVGGSLDDTTPIATDITPIFTHIPGAKGRVVIEGAGHMAFTDVCGLGFAQVVPQLKELCFQAGMRAPAAALAVTNAWTVAWLQRFVRGDGAHDAALHGGLQAALPAGAAAVVGF